MRKNIIKRILSYVLIFAILFGMVPDTALTVFAEEHINQVKVIVENNTRSEDEGAPWAGTLVDEWVDLNENSTAMTALTEALDRNSYYYVGAESNYISDINGLAAQTYWTYEDGWMFTLNDWFTDNGAGYYTVADGTLCAGDEIRFAYTLDMGIDLGGTWENNDTSLKDITFSTGTINSLGGSPSISDFQNDGSAEYEFHYELAVPAGTTGVVVTPTARNKNFQVRTYLDYPDTTMVGFKRSETVPVYEGATIYVVCGDPSWPSMNTNAWGNGLSCYATRYVFHVVYDTAGSTSNSAPKLTDDYASGQGEENIYVGETFSIDLSKVFTDADNDELTYTVSTNGADVEILTESTFTFEGSIESTTTLVFTASDGENEASYTLTVNVETKKAELNSLIIHTSTTPNDSNVLLKNQNDTYSSTELIFNPMQLNYTLAATLTDSTKQLRFRAEPNANGTSVSLHDAEGALIKDITWESGASKWANFLVGGKNKFSIVVTSSDPSVEPTTYNFEIDVIPTLTALTAENVYWDKSFSTSTAEYTMTVPSNIPTVTFDATPKSSDYTVTFNGEASNIVDVTNIDKVDIVVSKDGVSKTYTVNITKPQVTDAAFKVTPADAVVMVYDHESNIVTPNADGSYTGMFGSYEYTYSVSKNGYVTKSGMVPLEGGTVKVNLDKVLGEQPKEVDAYWSNFRGSDTNMAITDAKTPQNKDAENIAVKWTKKLGSGWSASPSVQIIVDNALIVMSDTTLYKLDLQSGEILATATMADKPNFGYTPPTYAAGMIFCPLASGTIQAFHAETLESLWIYKDSLGGQSLSPITYSDGYIYTGFWNGETKNANFVCLSITDEDTESTNEEKAATWKHTQLGGFYWAGSVVVNDAVIIGTDDGESGTSGTSKLYSFNKKNGEMISGHELTGAGDQRSSIAYDKNNGRLYFTTKGGYLYRADVDSSSGVISNLKGVNNNAQSTSTPVVYNGRVYYATGSGISSTGSSGNVVVADAETLEMMFAVGLKGYPQCSLLLSTAYERTTGEIYLYSTYNNRPGGISVIKVKADCLTAEDAELTELYDAKGYEQFCIASIICGEDGTLYYKNDSGNIFSIGVPTVVNVEKLIDLIGTVSIESEGAISAARGAYDTLSLLEKAMVENYNTLLAAEALYEEYVKADTVDQKIFAIGKVTNLSKSAIEEARKAYNALSESEKEKVTKLSVLTAAEASYKTLEEIGDEEIKNVEKLIDAIGQVTVNSEARIKKARNALNALTSAQKNLVSNFDDLLDAEDALEKAKIKDAEDKIDSIGNVTLSSKVAINRARTAYNRLDASNKKQVSNLSLLEAAEKEYAELLDASKTTKKTTTATAAKVSTAKTTTEALTTLDKVTMSVKELLDNLTSESLNGEVYDAIMAYEDLTEEEKLSLKKDGLVEDLKKQLSGKIQSDETTGISVSGAEWNVQLSIEDVLDIEEIQAMQDKLNGSQMLGLWNIYLENMVTGEKYEPTEPVLVKIPLELLGDFAVYDGLLVVHYTSEGVAEYLNCTVVGDSIVFNTSDFSNYAVVGYNGESPIDGLRTGSMNHESNTSGVPAMSWLPWTIAGCCGVAVIVMLAILMKKNRKDEQAK